MDISQLNHGSIEEPFWHLLYRYIWPFQYFRDVTRGSRIEQQQNYRHNRAIRQYLPGFAFKWLCLTLLWFAAGATFGDESPLVVPAAGCYVSGCLTSIVMIEILIAWSWLTHFPERF